MTNSDYVKRGVVGILILALFVLTILILKPIIMPIIFGLLFAYIFSPINTSIRSKIKNKNLATFLLVAGLILIIAIPTIYLVPSIVNQAFETYVSIQNLNMGQVVKQYIDTEFASSIGRNIDNIIGKTFTAFLAQFSNFLVNLPTLLFQFAVFLFTFFFAIRDAEELKKYISDLSPFSKSTEDKFQKEFRAITNTIIFGQVLIGILQGLALGAGLFFLGVPKVIVLTVIAAIASIIPILGSWLVWLPVSVYLLIAGQTFEGVFLLFYGGLFVSSLDNLLRPYMLSKQTNLPIALSLIGTIGGLFFFGIAGLVLGPLIIAYTLIVVELYRQGKLNDLFK